MYESFYNLKAEPFRLSPDHRFCFSHKSYAKAKAYMQYAIHRAEGFVMVTGKPGTGKTTLVNDLVDGLSHSKIVVATIVSTQLEADDLLRLVACNFGLDIDAPNKAVVLQGLSVRLRRHHEEGTRALLIIDEAQDLSASALEELRLLTNLQLNNQPLLQIFLVGQENLRDLVQKPSMEQVHQRLVAACHLESLSETDTKAYIKHRLDRVGWNDDPTIDEGVYPVVFQFSKGVPRRINLICSRFLLHGCVEEKHRIRAADVRTVVEELQHEQLTPVGFKAELPPLEDEEEFAVTEEDTETDVNQAAAPVSAPDDATIAQAVDDKDNQPLQTEAVSTSTFEKTNGDIADLCSLETQVKRENDTPDQSDESKQDVIQENYFALSNAVDLPSEPIPIRKTVETPQAEHGYGDRFANAQRQKEAAEARTHYYNEYQSGGHAATTPKRAILPKIALLLVMVVAVLIALYVVRPQFFQDGIETLQNKLGGTDGNSSTQSTTDPNLTPIIPAPPNIKENSVAAVADLGSPPVLEQSVKRTERTSAQAVEYTDNLEHPIQPVTAESVADAQKKTAQEPKLTPITATSKWDDRARDLETGSGAALQPIEIVQSVRLPETSDISVSQSAASADQKRDAQQILATRQADPQVDNIPATPPMEIPSTASDQPSVVENSESVTASSEVANLPGETVQEKPQPSETLPVTEQPKSIVLEKKILFRSDSTVIADEYRPILNEVVDWLENHPAYTAKIIGYADNRGDANYNLVLSLKRAKAVAGYLEKKNIARARLHIVGRGVYPESKISVTDDNATARRHLQRLVEIVAKPTSD